MCFEILLFSTIVQLFLFMDNTQLCSGLIPGFIVRDHFGRSWGLNVVLGIESGLPVCMASYNTHYIITVLYTVYITCTLLSLWLNSEMVLMYTVTFFHYHQAPKIVQFWLYVISVYLNIPHVPYSLPLLLYILCPVFNAKKFSSFDTVYSHVLFLSTPQMSEIIWY